MGKTTIFGPYERINRTGHNRNDSAHSIATQLNLRPYMPFSFLLQAVIKTSSVMAFNDAEADDLEDSVDHRTRNKPLTRAQYEALFFVFQFVFFFLA